jgi:serine/threonine protein kinase
MQAGDTLGHRYRLDELIGGGGMGDVWRAHDTLLERDVAIKVLLPALSGNEQFREQFRREALTVAGIRHPGVVDLHDYSEDRLADDSLVAFLVMEYVQAETLSTLLRRDDGFDVPRTLRIIEQAAEALHHAHKAGVVHSDVKPENILVREDGSVVLVDFGIARAHNAADAQAGDKVQGSVSYMSPEQLRDQELSAASDVYSLGVVAYECLSGTKPFTGDDRQVVIDGHLHQPPPPLPDRFPEAVSSMVMWALEKQPSRRYPTAAAMALGCRKIAETGQAPHPDTDDAHDPVVMPPVAEQRPPASPQDHEPDTTGVHRTAVMTAAASIAPPPTKRRWAMVTAAAVLLLVAALLLGHLWGPGDDVPTHDTAQDATGFAESTTATGPATSPEQDNSSATESDPPPANEPLPTEAATAPSSPSPEPTVEVPSVVGSSSSQAQSTLSDAGFGVTVKEVGHGVKECGVTKQNPRGGKQTATGSPVTITVHYAPLLGSCPSGSGLPLLPLGNG